MLYFVFWAIFSTPGPVRLRPRGQAQGDGDRRTDPAVMTSCNDRRAARSSCAEELVHVMFYFYFVQYFLTPRHSLFLRRHRALRPPRRGTRAGEGKSDEADGTSRLPYR